MQFTFVLTLIAMISAVIALPTGNTFMRANCKIADCVAALAPTVVGCVGAAAAGGVNPIADAACLAATANAALNFPAVCDQCVQEFGINTKVKAAEATVKNAAGNVVNKAEGVAAKIEGKLGGLFN